MFHFFKILAYFVNICACVLALFQKNDSTEVIANKILDVNSSQICIFWGKETAATNNVKFNFIFKRITHETPTFIINVKNAKISNNTEEMINTRDALNSDLFISVENVHNFRIQKVKNCLNFIAESNSLQPRSKFLLLLIGATKPIQIDLKKLLTISWELKFLDFSVLTMDHNDNSIVQNYNPFYKTYDQYDIMSRQLFSDKLKNMNGYKIKMILFNRPPKIEFVNKSNEFVINGVNYAFWKLASKALNFDFHYVEIHKNDLPSNYLFQKIEKGEIDATISPSILGVQLTNHYKKGTLITGKYFREAEMYLIVPIIYSKSSSNREFYLAILKHSILTALIIIVKLVVIKLCKINSNIWSTFYLFALLFGITVDKKPKMSLERLIYIILAFFSIQYSSNIFAVFSNDKVIKNEEIIYDAFQEIKRPSLDLYVPNTFFQSEESYDGDEIIKNLKAHSLTIKYDKECYKKLADKKDRFCFNSAIEAKYMISKYRNSDKSPAMKIAKPLIMNDYFVPVFPKGSPFIKKFDKKFQQVLESGLRDHIPDAKRYFDIHKKKENHFIVFDLTSNINNQLIIFAVGCVIGIFIFIFELV